jgi:hypothetical protein
MHTGCYPHPQASTLCVEVFIVVFLRIAHFIHPNA